VPSGEQECPLQLNDHIIIGNTKMVVGRVVERPASPPQPSAPTTATEEGQGEAEKKSIFMGNFQPNLNHPIFRALRDSMKEEEERQRRVQAKRKLYQMLTQEEKADRKRVREHYTDRAARRQHLHKSTAAKRDNQANSSEAVGMAGSRDEAPLPAARFQRPGPEITQLQPPQENKGRSLLKRMGWKEGEGLGRENTGIVDPIQGNFDISLLSLHDSSCDTLV
jgi:RNA-binding protein 5/10